MGVVEFMNEVREAVKDLQEQKAELEKQRKLRRSKWRRR